jgi:mono/diheme cytochrome c family protein
MICIIFSFSALLELAYGFLNRINLLIMKKKSSSTEFLRIVAIATFLLITSNISLAQSKLWSVPKDAADLKNPEASDAASIKNGRTLYQAYCSPCHGDKGKGDGPASASLNPKPADHTSEAVQAESDGTIYYQISEGHAHTAMPPFKAVLHPEQRWAIVNYIRTLSKKSK